jgi:hypothetical protein
MNLLKIRKLLMCLNAAVYTVSNCVKVINQQAGKLKAQDMELEQDFICGHWISQTGNRAATIIKTVICYNVAVFRDGKLEKQFTLFPHHERTFRMCNLSQKMYSPVYLEPDGRRLVMECYGPFVRDHEAGTCYGNPCLQENEDFSETAFETGGY